ncbi:MAG: 50S ribosomal protein L10 [Candidatus Nanoarchaeia archaeon]|nr:50S ribosomal protein L10 [Candidatus Nanoarchaeia archaeon]
MAHVSEQKKKTVNEFQKLVDSYPVIGLVDMENLPAPQLQKMRLQLRDTAVIKMTKTRLMKIVFENSKEKKKGIENLNDHLKGMPALIFTKHDPFKLAKILKKSRSNAPAKAGQTAPRDIVVTAGPTSFSPGPIISELASAGIKTGIENGKIAIKQDAVVVKEGEVVNAQMAGVLSRLGVQPMEIGLNLVAVYDNGTIFKRDVLEIDEDEFMDKIKQAYSSSITIALELSFLTDATTEIMIAKAFNNAKAVALAQNIITDETKEQIIAKANNEMLALKSKLNIPDVPKQEIKQKTAEQEKQQKETEEDKGQPEKKTEAKQEKEQKEDKKQEQSSKPDEKSGEQ